MGDSITIERDSQLDKFVFVYCMNGEVFAEGFYEGDDIVLPSFDIPGDILFTVFIPKNPEQEIIIEKREVVDDFH